jgi:hypothetical protein
MREREEREREQNRINRINRERLIRQQPTNYDPNHPTNQRIQRQHNSQMAPQLRPAQRSYTPRTPSHSPPPTPTPLQQAYDELSDSSDEEEEGEIIEYNNVHNLADSLSNIQNTYMRNIRNLQSSAGQTFSQISYQIRRLQRQQRNRLPQNSRTISLKMVENFNEGYYLGNLTDEENMSCCVCLETCKLTTTVGFNCGHGCCSGCAIETIKKTKKCPMCRGHITQISISKDIPINDFNNLNTSIKF